MMPAGAMLTTAWASGRFIGLHRQEFRSSYNGGFHSLSPTQASATTVTLAQSQDASHFAKGDYVASFSSISKLGHHRRVVRRLLALALFPVDLRVRTTLRQRFRGEDVV